MKVAALPYREPLPLGNWFLSIKFRGALSCFAPHHHSSFLISNSTACQSCNVFVLYFKGASSCVAGSCMSIWTPFLRLSNRETTPRSKASRSSSAERAAGASLRPPPTKPAPLAYIQRCLSRRRNASAPMAASSRRASRPTVKHRMRSIRSCSTMRTPTSRSP